MPATFQSKYSEHRMMMEGNTHKKSLNTDIDYDMRSIQTPGKSGMAWDYKPQASVAFSPAPYNQSYHQSGKVPHVTFKDEPVDRPDLIGQSQVEPQYAPV